ncbi:MAG: O-antigen ligase family protein [Actinomycetota bacterium]|nr:O-antigen ligase family protein [Actinomycetota bacterium]
MTSLARVLLENHSGHREQFGPASERFAERRIGIIWALLFFDAIPAVRVSTIVEIPPVVARLAGITALLLAALLAVTLNRRFQFKPNLVLGLLTVLAIIAVASSARGTAGVGALFRCGRYALFLTVLWLLTPWWHRRDLLVAKCHIWVLAGVSGTVVAGLVIAPSVALAGSDGRLVGALWPIPAPQVAQYAAVLAGITFLLWLTRRITGGLTVLFAGGGTVLLLLTQTRTAFVGLVAGLFFATASLLLSRRRARRFVLISVLLVPLALVTLAPALSTWYQRNQSSEQLASLTGRTYVWERLREEPRSEFVQWFGIGLSDKSFGGHAIDNAWLAVYHEEGLVGVALVAAILLSVLLTALLHPSVPERAIALFLVVFALVSSYTEIGLGDVSPFLLHIAVAASLLAPTASARRRAAEVPVR